MTAPYGLIPGLFIDPRRHHGERSQREKQGEPAYSYKGPKPPPLANNGGRETAAPRAEVLVHSRAGAINGWHSLPP